MKFWKVEIKYSKIAIPDVILFNIKASAEWYKEDKLKHNSMAVWANVSEKPIDIILPE